MDIKKLEKMYSEGVAICKCKVCRAKIRLEPDADTGYCDKCDKVVAVRNPFIEAGIII